MAPFANWQPFSISVTDEIFRIIWFITLFFQKISDSYMFIHFHYTFNYTKKWAKKQFLINFINSERFVLFTCIILLRNKTLWIKYCCKILWCNVNFSGEQHRAVCKNPLSLKLTVRFHFPFINISISLKILYGNDTWHYFISIFCLIPLIKIIWKV